MKIAITGATGFVGKHLSEYFNSQKIITVPLSRDLFLDKNAAILATKLMNCDVVINLAGASISHRWTTEYKKEIYDSRIQTTKRLVDTINSLPHKPSLLLSASAVGYYSSKGSYSEKNAEMGEGFLAEVCRDWEEQATRVCSDVRCVITRFGVIFSKDGGAYPQMIKSVRFGFTTRIGKGEGYLSWISMTDLIRAFDFVIKHDELSRVVNFCSPHPITSYDFAQQTANHFHSKVTIPLPACLLTKVLGEQASIMTDGQQVYPERLLNAGFTFKTATYESFLGSLL